MATYILETYSIKNNNPKMEHSEIFLAEGYTIEDLKNIFTEEIDKQLEYNLEKNENKLEITEKVNYLADHVYRMEKTVKENNQVIFHGTLQRRYFNDFPVVKRI